MRSLAFATDDASSPEPRHADCRRVEVRSITDACYTLVEDTSVEKGARRFRTAYAGLPVVANDDGSFTVVDTHTRLVRIAASP
jgi:hypothetical protein